MACRAGTAPQRRSAGQRHLGPILTKGKRAAAPPSSITQTPSMDTIPSQLDSAARFRGWWSAQIARRTSAKGGSPGFGALLLACCKVHWFDLGACALAMAMAKREEMEGVQEAGGRRQKSRLRAFPTHRIAISSTEYLRARPRPGTPMYTQLSLRLKFLAASIAADSAQHWLQAVAWTTKSPRNAPAADARASSQSESLHEAKVANQKSRVWTPEAPAAFAKMAFSTP